jgi:hypothetical protein
MKAWTIVEPAFLRMSHAHAKVIRSEVAVRLELARMTPHNGVADSSDFSKYNK